MTQGKSLQASMEAIDKKYGKGSVINGTEVVKTERISTGSLSLDIITGGGWGIGRHVELIGPESSGKTTICIHSMVSVQSRYPDKKVLIIDSEHAFDREYAISLGVDMEKVVFCQPDNGEQGLDVLEILIQSGSISLGIVDSIATLTPRAEIEGEMGESKLGAHARLMSQALRKLTAIMNTHGVPVLWTNQIREKIGVLFGTPETTPGGNAMKFYASIRVDIRKSAGDKDSDGNVINSKVKAKTIKNKLAPPFQVCEFDIVFGKGIDKPSEVLFFATGLDIIRKSGSWYSYGDMKLGQGAQAVKEYLSENTELLEELELNIRAAYGI